MSSQADIRAKLHVGWYHMEWAGICQGKGSAGMQSQVEGVSRPVGFSIQEKA